MKRIHIIILTTPGSPPEPWSNFKKLCDAKGFPYHSLKSLSFPIQYKEFTIYKEPYN